MMGQDDTVGTYCDFSYAVFGAEYDAISSVSIQILFQTYTGNTTRVSKEYWTPLGGHNIEVHRYADTMKTHLEMNLRHDCHKDGMDYRIKMRLSFANFLPTPPDS